MDTDKVDINHKIAEIKKRILLAGIVFPSIQQPSFINTTKQSTTLICPSILYSNEHLSLFFYCFIPGWLFIRPEMASIILQKVKRPPTWLNGKNKIASIAIPFPHSKRKSRSLQQNAVVCEIPYNVPSS